MPTLAAYAVTWLAAVTSRATPRTVENYERILARHWLPAFGQLPLEALRRRGLRAHVVDVLVGRLAPATARHAVAVLSACLAAACDDDLLGTNPAARLTRTMAPPAWTVVALPREALAGFLGAAQTDAPALYPLFLVLARTGLRVGEGLGLRWSDVDLAARILTVRASWDDGGLHAPKGGVGRAVDLSRQAVTVLAAQRNGGVWCFPSGRGAPWSRHYVARVMKRLCGRAGLVARYTPHSLRHTYASLLLARGVPIQYVQRQLGHRSITLTVDLYGRHCPLRDLAAVDALDDS